MRFPFTLGPEAHEETFLVDETSARRARSERKSHEVASRKHFLVDETFAARARTQRNLTKWPLGNLFL